MDGSFDFRKAVLGAKLKEKRQNKKGKRQNKKTKRENFMAKISRDSVDKYSNSGTYFQLKNNGDSAFVRFLYRDIRDICAYVVHNVKDGDESKYGIDVNCLREAYDSPVSDCPLCAAGYKQSVKVVVPLYNVSTGEIQMWVRGKNFIGKMETMFARIPSDVDICSQVYEIIRVGEAGDNRTDYTLIPSDAPDDTKLEDFDLPEPLGTAIKDYSAEQMQNFVESGSFEAKSAVPVRRSTTRETSNYDRGRANTPNRDTRVIRRTPRNNF